MYARKEAMNYAKSMPQMYKVDRRDKMLKSKKGKYSRKISLDWEKVCKKSRKELG